MKYIVRTSVFILIIPESECILTAEMVNLVFYNYSLFLSIPLALLAGAFTIVAPEAFKKLRNGK
jgi:hypothetical protein